MFCYSVALSKVKSTRYICIVALAISAVLSRTGLAVDTMLATDKEVKINVPVLTNSLPVQLGSSLNTQYATDLTPDPSAGVLHLGTMTVEEAVRYPALIGDIYLGNSIGEKLMPSAKDGFPTMNPSTAYLTSWLNKQWASVNLNLAYVHPIEKPEDQLSVGVSRTFTTLINRLSVSVGAYLFSDLDNRDWSHTTNLSMDYWWKCWDFSMFVERRQDLNLSEHSVWTAIKTKF